MRRKQIRYSILQLVLDIFGDLLSKKQPYDYQRSHADRYEVLYIPVHLIWKVKIRLLSKIALSCSLCLTIVVIIFTVIRASGLEWRDRLDVVWGVYFHVMAAEVGLILVCMTAFRTLFISQSSANQSHATLKKLFDPRR